MYPERALVVGMGISGRSVCELLVREGVHVIATDLRLREAFHGELDGLEEKGCALRLGSHRSEDFLGVDQIVVSPGVPLEIEPLVQARAKGIEVIGELEWAWRQIQTPVVAVTGTNGKTTTTSIIGDMIRGAGKRVFIGGNIGTPLSRWVLQGDEADVLVLEVSSFQLDTASQFSPRVGVLLNVTEDHLDRYESYSAYVSSKFSLFARQRRDDVAVVNGDDSICRSRLREIPGRVLLYSRSDPSSSGRMRGLHIEVEIPWMASFTLDLRNSRLKGVHNEENILASVLASTVIGVSPATMQDVIDNFQGLPHRVEWVRTWNSIDFYDDSKGTNVGAVIKALENFDRPVLLLMGGRDKLGSYAPLATLLHAKGKGAFVFGEAAFRLEEELKDAVPTQSFSDLEEAFDAAVNQAASIELSPSAFCMESG